jgi:hypothetical protein
MRRNAHALGIIDDDERRCARPVSIFNFSLRLGIYPQFGRLIFFFIYRNYYGIPKEFIRQYFLILDGVA